jgi:hypothetical protein
MPLADFKQFPLSVFDNVPVLWRLWDDTNRFCYIGDPPRLDIFIHVLVRTVPVYLCLRLYLTSWFYHAALHFQSRRHQQPDPVKARKFSESVYYTTTYLFFSLYGGFLAASAGFLPWANGVFDTVPDWFTFDFMSTEHAPTRWYFYLQVTHYVTGIIVLLFGLETRAKYADRYVMSVHHLVTIALEVSSIHVGIWRYGHLVAFTHDLSDIFLEWSKSVLYLWGADAANITFAIFAIIFFFTRLVYLPFVLLRKLFFTPGFHAGLEFMYACLFFTLQTLHLVWMGQIAKIVLRALSGGPLGDVRDHDEWRSAEIEAEMADCNAKGVADTVLFNELSLLSDGTEVAG